MVCYYVPVSVTHGELCWDSGCESQCVILRHWLWIIVSYAESVVVNDGVLCWASGCEALWTMLRSVCMNHGVNAVLVDMNHGSEPLAELTLHDSRPLVQHNTPWFTNHWIRISHHDSQPLVQHTSPWFISTSTAFTPWFIHTERSIVHKIMVCYAVPVVVNHGELAQPVVQNHVLLC
jgi:hypothetical protein